MHDLLYALGGFYQAYRAAQDAGIWWFTLDVEARQHYLESLAIIHNLIK